MRCVGGRQLAQPFEVEQMYCLWFCRQMLCVVGGKQVENQRSR